MSGALKVSHKTEERTLKCDLESPRSYKLSLGDKSHWLTGRQQRNHLQGSEQKLRLLPAFQPRETYAGFTGHALSGTTESPPAPVLAHIPLSGLRGLLAKNLPVLSPNKLRSPIGCYGNYIMQRKLINMSADRRPGSKGFRKTVRSKWIWYTCDKYKLLRRKKNLMKNFKNPALRFLCKHVLNPCTSLRKMRCKQVQLIWGWVCKSYGLESAEDSDPVP